MTGREVFEDYRSRVLILRQHPLTFLREELREPRIRSCADLHRVRNRQRATVAGLLFVRQKPGSAKGVMFMTIEERERRRQRHYVAIPVRRQRRLASRSSCWLLIGQTVPA